MYGLLTIVMLSVSAPVEYTTLPPQPPGYIDKWLHLLKRHMAHQIITAGPDAPCNISGKLFPHLGILREEAMRMELIDDNEPIMMNFEYAMNELRLLRQRYEILHDAPLASDSQRFPSAIVATEQRQLATEYYAYLSSRVIRNSDELKQIIRLQHEATRLMLIWDKVSLTSPSYYISVRRSALRDLYRELGPAAYYKGTVPLAIPIYNFVDAN